VFCLATPSASVVGDGISYPILQAHSLTGNCAASKRTAVSFCGLQCKALSCQHIARSSRPAAAPRRPYVMNQAINRQHGLAMTDSWSDDVNGQQPRPQPSTMIHPSIHPNSPWSLPSRILPPLLPPLLAVSHSTVIRYSLVGRLTRRS
jgi:hypothetical protein